MRGALLTTCVVILFMSETTSAFQETNKLLGALADVETTVSGSISCAASLTEPNDIGRIVASTTGLYSNLTQLNSRISTINAAISLMLIIPVVNIVGQPILGPVSGILTAIGRVLSITTTLAEPILHTMEDLEGPLKKTKDNGAAAQNVLSTVLRSAVSDKAYLSQLATEISKVDCSARSGYLQTLEATATGMVSAPNMVIELRRADAVCREIQNYVVTTNAQINDDVLAGFELGLKALTAFNNGLDPIQKYLDAVDEVLDHQLCIPEVNEILEALNLPGLIDTIEKAGKEVLDDVIEVGKDMIDDLEKVFGGWGRKRRPKKKGRRPRRAICFTVRGILAGTGAITGGWFAAAEFLVKKIFNDVMPGLPAVDKEIRKLTDKLLPFRTDFDLATKAEQFIPSATVVTLFVNQDYSSVFTNRPGQAKITESAPAVCPGQTAALGA